MADPPDARTGLKVPPVGTRLKRGSVVSHLVLTFTMVGLAFSSEENLCA